MPPAPTPARTGYADLPLHGGKAPPWLFQRMVKLSRAIGLSVIEDQGPEELLRRLSDPYWFQALGCVLGFDWHSSGLTTTTCGALKEGWRGVARETGLFFAGGKGATSRKTPSEIASVGEHEGKDLSPLVYASRMAAKVDSAALQDGFQLYHHTFIFTRSGQWAVVQQGMREETRYARRYHWLGAQVQEFVREPHAAIYGQRQGQVLNLVARESDAARDTIASLAVEEKPKAIVADLQRLKGLSLRALSLVAELVYGTPPSWRDPVVYSFAHGGKDGHPYPVDRPTYDETIAFFSRALRRAKVGDREHMESLRRLQQWHQEPLVPRPGAGAFPPR